ncbi:hypothetical protein SDC9_109129 [bioreactor metagenome]|uniref:Uncharacterized protein n=1 Tax=bioreactor metagenome TaxID=1076179 RepID=A0A645BGE5_9ZZZZ
MHFRRLGIFFSDLNIFLAQPIDQLIKKKNRIDAFSRFSFIFFGNARADKNYLHAVPVDLLQNLRMSDGGGYDGRQTVDEFRKIFFHEQYGCGTAGGDDIFHLLFLHQARILVGYLGGADSGFLHSGKTELF